jgi:hypothetical protein
MAAWNRITVNVGDCLVTRAGKQTRWTVVGAPYKNKKGRAYARLRCTCGAESTVRLDVVLRDRSNGCAKCMGIERRDWPEIGSTVGGYSVLAMTSTTQGAKMKARCVECGRVAWKELSAVRSAVKAGRPSACKNCRPWRQLKPNPLGRHLRAVYKRNFAGISLPQLQILITSACFYCGGPPTNVFRTDRRKTANEVIRYQGIDEVVYGAGHVLGNMLPCCIVCNKAKNNHSLDDFCAWYNRRRIHRYRLSPEKLIKAARDLGEHLKTVTQVMEQ